MGKFRLALVLITLLAGSLRAVESRQVLDSRRVQVLANQLLLLESQVELYKLQHRDIAPDFVNWQWRQLELKTDAEGHFDKNGLFGPYLSSAPLNPMNGSSEVVLVNSAKPDIELDGEHLGYAYVPSTGKFWPTDSSGKRLLDRNLKKAYPEAF